MARTANRNADIQALVESFAGELTTLVRRTALEQVQAALTATMKTGRLRTGRMDSLMQSKKTTRGPSYILAMRLSDC